MSWFCGLGVKRKSNETVREQVEPEMLRFICSLCTRVWDFGTKGTPQENCHQFTRTRCHGLFAWAMESLPRSSLPNTLFLATRVPPLPLKNPATCHTQDRSLGVGWIDPGQKGHSFCITFEPVRVVMSWNSTGLQVDGRAGVKIRQSAGYRQGHYQGLDRSFMQCRFFSLGLHGEGLAGQIM